MEGCSAPERGGSTVGCGVQEAGSPAHPLLVSILQVTPSLRLPRGGWRAAGLSSASPSVRAPAGCGGACGAPGAPAGGAGARGLRWEPRACLRLEGVVPTLLPLTSRPFRGPPPPATSGAAGILTACECGRRGTARGEGRRGPGQRGERGAWPERRGLAWAEASGSRAEEQPWRLHRVGGRRGARGREGKGRPGVGDGWVPWAKSQVEARKRAAGG